MIKPTIIITGNSAGQWYINTLNKYMPSNNKDEKAYNIIQTDFGQINTLLPNKMVEAAKYLEPYFIKIEAEKTPYILANITLHEAVPYFTIKPKHFISIKSIINAETSNRLLKVGLLGTNYTMTNNYWKKTFPYLQFEKLSGELMQAIDDLRKCYYNDTDKVLAIKVFKHLQNIKIDYWILACTELAIAYDDADVELPMIHLPKLQCSYLIKSKA